jgi:hypothetical protein
VRAVVKWIGFALVAVSVTVLPFAIWISGSWGLVSLTSGVIGAFLLMIGLGGKAPVVGGNDVLAQVPPGPLGQDLRGFPGAQVFDHGAPPSDEASHGDPDT